MSVHRRREKVEPAHARLSIVRQCELLSISRSGYDEHPRTATAEDLEVLRLIDEAFMETPFYGTRRMVILLRRHGHVVGRKRVRRLMRTLGLTAIYQKPRTTVPHPEHRIFPYLLRDMVIDRPNQVWCADITYIPMRRGFLYLVAIMDWATRKVLSWKLSNTGRWMDNVFIERLWRSLKYECVYLNAFETGSEARAGIGRWITFYNADRPHAALGARTPDQAYAAGPDETKMAA